MTTLMRRAPLLCTVLLTGCLIAACGSSSSTTSKTPSAAASTGSAGGAGGAGGGPGGARFSAFRQCLAQHGVTLPNRRPGSRRPGAGGPGGPGGPGGGFFGGGGGGAGAGGGLAQRNPKLAAAIQACGGFRGGGRRFRLSRTAINSYVACVRQHGYNLPNPNFSGKGPVFPASIRTDPKFQSASRACQSLLVPQRTGAGGSTVRS